MSFTAKVKKTGQLFQATNEMGRDGALGKDAHTLEKGKSYAGHLFLDSQPRNSPWVEFSGATWGVFREDELENFPVSLRLVHY